MERRMRVCAHCAEGFALASTGRPPKYCSSACRKSAWEKAKFEAAVDQAVVVALAKAVAAEQRKSRRENRRNETPTLPEIRRNETPAPAPQPPRAPVPPARPVMPLPDPAVPRALRKSLFPSFRRRPDEQPRLFDDQGQPDA
ncbi:hypothetical protein [Streptomyces sp. WAC01280]|uniref:hypothetical protein n=1 Tax=Streptomyces sp. WAC01280 TaxID=2487424 RepID=UPI000F76C6F9|nr:hypothetical protein [Streptomyces sp. WAC01280]RSS59836.1 hypothetical protein EF909_08220 [Streptomyces sp. WAC01280]